MFVRSQDSDQPSLVVAEGTTFVLNSDHLSKHPNLVINLRPRTTAALLVAAGRPPSPPPRLSDEGAFEHVEKTDGLIDLHRRDGEGRVAGYSVPFLSRLFDALDPAAPTPPPTVQWHIPSDDTGVQRCSCGGQIPQADMSQPGGVQPGRAAALSDHQKIRAGGFRQIITAPVPSFVSNLEISIVTYNIWDIIVDPGAVLVLDNDVSYLWVRNFFCYRGARVVQRSGYLSADIFGTMRGGISPFIRFYGLEESAVGPVLKLDYTALLHDVPTKP